MAKAPDPSQTPQARKQSLRILSQILAGRTGGPELDSFSAIQWDSLTQEARVEGVGPLLYWALSETGRIACLPKSARDALRAMYLSTRMHNERILGELETLVRRFAETGIPLVALKGICFALTIYPDRGLRPMADLDLLVPASQFSAAVRIAQRLGYVDL
ncbi:MAG: nucleotidyltransferase family protein, partial [Bacteroidota bacterium]